MKDEFIIGFLILFVVLLIIVGPLLTIWSLNTLFGLGIAYNFFTWLAALLLGAVIKSSVKVHK